MKDDIIFHIGDIQTLVRQYPHIVRQETESVMRVIMARLESAVVEYTPTGVGGEAGLRGSIHGEVTLFGESVKGELGSPLPYGEVVEKGRRPGMGMPPIEPLKLWVRRKLGLPEDEAGSVVWAIAKKIAKEGTDGAEMFKKGWEDNEAWVMQQIKTIPQRVVDRTEAL